MIKIAICDDEKEISEQLKKLVANILTEKKVESEICLYQSGQELLQHIMDFRIVFLDIDMPKMDGIQVGELIREKNGNCFVIMETGMDKRVYEAFRFGAIRSLPKPFRSEEVEEALQTVLSRMIGSKKISVSLNRVSCNLEQSQIVYARSVNSEVELFTEKAKFRKDVTLEQLEKELDSHMFFRIHRQYLINLNYVKEKPTYKIFVNGTELPVARSRKNALIYAWMEFELKYRKGM